jgi:predicted MFS family arabinose efflux permease
MRFPPALRALDHRDFRLFWFGQGISVMGSWMQTVGQAWLVLELTGSPFKLGLVSALQFGPLLLFSLVAGALIDRWPKRRLVTGTQLALMVPALTLALLSWTRVVQYWHVAGLALTVGVVNALDMPSRQAIVAEIVGRDDLLNAIALNSAIFNAARVTGPALGGLLIAHYGVAPAFLLNGLSFAPVVLALLAMDHVAPARPSRHTTIGQEIGDGVRYALRTPQVSLVLFLVLAVSAFAINHNVTVPLLAREVLGLGAKGFGLLMASLGAGALTGALLMALVSGRGRPRPVALIVPAVVVTSGVLSLSAVRQFHVAAAILFVVGLSQIVFLTSCNTTVQVAVPDELRGRVVSVYMLVFAGMTPVGAFLVGAVAEAFGVPAAFTFGGGLALACVLAQAGRFYRARGLT